ncbi:hypothetical protein OsJ_23774 [Oryza sativa Japonica Group]|uniref:Uncharacterized protein n=1 Tax=Oryza sativa subsp. japonica TaxID=39947 RepID=B9FWI4_ORYSJ|nr:hypothetical protein OsJ_23774 [Oryza sativa Japonica Group]
MKQRAVPMDMNRQQDTVCSKIWRATE